MNSVQLLFVTATLVCCSAAFAHALGEWQEVAHAPAGRDSFGFACTVNTHKDEDLRVWIIGGRDDNGPQRDMYYYSVVHRRFEKFHNTEGFDSDIIDFHLVALMAEGHNEQLIAIGGRHFHPNVASTHDELQIYDHGWGWITAEGDSLEEERRVPTPPPTYWSGLWVSVGEIGPDILEMYMVGGITPNGLSKRHANLELNMSDEHAAPHAHWVAGDMDHHGTEGVSYPNRSFGICCAHHNPGMKTKKALCFGGTTLTDDHHDTWEADYGSHHWHKWTTTGDIPHARRFHSCEFVAPDKFAVQGGYDSHRGAPVEDPSTFVLDTVTKVWTRVVNKAATDGHLQSAYFGKMTTCLFQNGSYQTFLFGGAVSATHHQDDLFIWDGMSHGFVGVSLEDSHGGGGGGSTATHAQLKPEGRAHHSAVVLHEKIVLMNGINTDGELLRDVWLYTPAKGEWHKHHIHQRWAPRFGAPAATLAGLVYCYGGWLDIDRKSTVKELLEVDVSADEAKIVPDTGAHDTPGGRAYHSSVSQHSVFVVAGGMRDEAVITADWHGFSAIEQKWHQLFLDGNQTGPAPAFLVRYGAIGLTVNETTAIWGLGFGEKAYADLFWVTDVNFDKQSFKLTPFDTSHAHLDKRDYVRGFATAILAGTFLLVCDGVSMEGISPPIHSNCYSVDTVYYEWYPIATEADYLLSGSTMVHFGDALYTFFGQRSNTVALISSMNDDVLVYKFDSAFICQGGQREGCVACSAGTVLDDSAQNCVPTPAGTFSDDPFSPPKKCRAGTHLHAKAASHAAECVPCDFGFFSDVEGADTCKPCPAGSVCPIGADHVLEGGSPRAEALLHIPVDPTEHHPPEYKAPPVPLYPVIIIISVTLVVLIVVALLLVVGTWAKKKRLRYYLTDEQQKKLTQMAKERATGRFGLTEQDFMRLLVEDRTVLQAHDVTPDFANQVFYSIDQYKSGYIYGFQLVEAIALCVEAGKMGRFPGTLSHETGKPIKIGKSYRIAQAFNLASLDLFEDAHATAQPGQSPKIQRNWYGGIFSIVAVVLLVALILATVLNFGLSNVVESKSAVPRAVIGKDFEKQVHNEVRVHVEYYALLREMEHIHDLEHACLKNVGTKSTECASASAVFEGIKDAKTHHAATDTTLECHYDKEEHACVVDWTCPDCYIDEGATGGSLTLRVSPAIAAPIIRVLTRVGSGIHGQTASEWGELHPAGGTMQHSSVEVFSRPHDPTMNSMYSGFPATQFSVALTPTYFEVQGFASLVGDEEWLRKTGYHVRQSSEPVPGHTLPPAQFDRYFDVPVTVSFTVDSGALLVRRVLTSSLVDLGNALLGSVAGFMGLVVFLINCVDDKGANENYKEEKTLLDTVSEDVNSARDEAEAAELERTFGLDAPLSPSTAGLSFAMKSALMDRSHRFAPGGNFGAEEFEQLQQLMSSGMSLKQAEAVLSVQGQQFAQVSALIARLPASPGGGNNNFLSASSSPAAPPPTGGGSSFVLDPAPSSHSYNNPVAAPSAAVVPSPPPPAPPAAAAAEMPQGLPAGANPDDYYHDPEFGWIIKPSVTPPTKASVSAVLNQQTNAFASSTTPAAVPISSTPAQGVVPEVDLEWDEL